MKTNDNARRALGLAKSIQGLSPRQSTSQSGTDTSLQAQELATLDSVLLFDNLIPGGPVSRSCKRLYLDGHYRQAVVDAFICLEQEVRKKSKQTGNGASLMRTVFSANTPVLRINDNINISQKDEQQGYMDIMAGAMTGIRNPRAHEHDWPDNAESALQLIVIAHHLMGKVGQSRRKRR